MAYIAESAVAFDIDTPLQRQLNKMFVFAIWWNRFGVAFFALSFSFLCDHSSLAVEARGSTQNMERQAGLHSDTAFLLF